MSEKYPWWHVSPRFKHALI